MKNKYLKSYNKFLSYLLSLLGFGIAFSNGCAMYGTPAEYGTPNATFKVNGQVTDEQSIPIPKIRVVLQFDTTYTDIQGKYLVKTVSFPESQTFKIEFDDVDGTQNYQYEGLDTSAIFSNPKFTGGSGNWNYGETSAELNIQLKKSN